MASTSVSSPQSFAVVTPKPGLIRLYTLRICYLILAVGLGLVIWPSVVSHTSDFAIRNGAQMSLLAGIGLVALLGLRYPVKMIPLLLFELTWKIIYMVAFALPLWSAHQINAAVASDIAACALVIIFLPLMPWGYVVKEFAAAPGDRWR